MDVDVAGDEWAIRAPDGAIEKSRLLLNAIKQEIPASAAGLADMVRLRTGNRFHSEASMYAEEAGVSWRDIMLANISYDLTIMALGCSTVALPTPSGPVLARNMDWWPEDVLARCSYLVRVFRDGKLVLFNAGWPGSIGVVSGLSVKGFAVVLNAVSSPDGVDATGYPVMLHIRRVLEDAADFGEAVHMLSRQRLAASCLLTVVGTKNFQRVVIERSPKRHSHRWAADDEPLVATNDYRVLARPKSDDANELLKTTCSRYDALNGMYSARSFEEEVEDAELLYNLTDPSVIQTITAQHVIIRPRLGEIRLFVPRKLVE